MLISIKKKKKHCLFLVLLFFFSIYLSPYSLVNALGPSLWILNILHSQQLSLIIYIYKEASHCSLFRHAPFLLLRFVDFLGMHELGVATGERIRQHQRHTQTGV